MRGATIRFVMAVVGLVAFSVYAAGAYVTYAIIQLVLADRPSSMTIISIFIGITLLVGFLSYRYGTAQLLASMETVGAFGPRIEWFNGRVTALSAEMEIDQPEIWFTDMEEPNAFAMSGPNGGVVVFDTTLFSLLSDDELEAILAHELAHLESHDGLVQLLAFTGLQTVVGVVSLLLLPVMLLLTGIAKANAWIRGTPSAWTKSLAWKFRTVIFAFVMIVPMIVTFVLLVRSRRREYAADRRAAEVTDNPLALARALATIHEAMTEELKLKGLEPFGSEGHPVPETLYRLFSTHPDVKSRIAKLRAMEKETERRQ